MNNFAAFLTPEEAFATYTITIPGHSLAELRVMAKNEAKCMNCGAHVWRYGNCGLCFTCTTGAADASDDYEIGDPY